MVGLFPGKAVLVIDGGAPRTVPVGANVSGIRLIAVEGPGAGPELDALLDDPAGRSAVLRAIERVEEEPSLLGAASHLMAIATRPGA